jgi:hypothetical protein
MGESTSVAATGRWRGGRKLATNHWLFWWVEVALVAGLYLVYSAIRNVSAGEPGDAFANAMRIMDLQQRMRINWELSWQQWALDHESLIIVSNYFYGAAYVLVTLGTLVFLYRRFPDSYPLWRNTLVVGTLLALVGFATFPLMPPRLLDVHDAFGTWGFVDTMATYPTLWSFQSETMTAISNQFAAMPSLHCGWALWVCAALWPHLATWWAKALAAGYAIVTVIVVVITGNHFFLDAVGGAFVMGVGYLVAIAVTRAGRTRGVGQGEVGNQAAALPAG